MSEDKNKQNNKQPIKEVKIEDIYSEKKHQIGENLSHTEQLRKGSEIPPRPPKPSKNDKE